MMIKPELFLLKFVLVNPGVIFGKVLSSGNSCISLSLGFC